MTQYEKIKSWIKDHEEDIRKQHFLLGASGIIQRVNEMEDKRLIGKILGTNDKNKINWYYNGIQFLKERKNTGD